MKEINELLEELQADHYRSGRFGVINSADLYNDCLFHFNNVNTEGFNRLSPEERGSQILYILQAQNLELLQRVQNLESILEHYHESFIGKF